MGDRCPACRKPVYFAERKVSFGKAYHPQCLRCNECKKRLNPGGHSEHDGKPYCDIPCYGALFGPRGFGRGGVESHSSFGAGLDSTTEDPEKRLEDNQMVYSNIHKYNASRATNSGLGQPITYREINQKIVFECLVPIFWEVDTPVCFGDKGFFNKNLQKRLARHGNKKTKTMRKHRTAHEQDMDVSSAEFIPPEGMFTNLRCTSKAHTSDIILMLFQKYDVSNDPSKFQLWAVNANPKYTHIFEDNDCPLTEMFRFPETECSITIRGVQAPPVPDMPPPAHMTTLSETAETGDGNDDDEGTATGDADGTPGEEQESVLEEMPTIIIEDTDEDATGGASADDTPKGFTKQLSKRSAQQERQISVYGNLSMVELQQFVTLFDKEEQRELVRCRQRWLTVKQRLMELIQRHLAAPEVKGGKATGPLSQEEFIRWRIKLGPAKYDAWRAANALPEPVWCVQSAH